MSCRRDCHHTCEGAVLDEGRGNGGVVYSYKVVALRKSGNP